jgi:peptidyl-prolyl cis-trans isomerase D
MKKILVSLLVFTIYWQNSFSQTDTSRVTLDAEIWAKSRKTAFRNTADDSLFVANNSEAPFQYNIYNRSQNLGGLEFLFFSSRKGEVLGPVMLNGYAMLFKVVRYDSSLKARVSHIFVQPAGKKSKDTLNAQKKAEKILTEIKGGKNFAELAKQVSQDTVSGKRGGEIGWLWVTTLEPAMATFLRNAKPGETAVVRSAEGIHVMRLEEEKVRDRFRVVMLPLVKKL